MERVRAAIRIQSVFRGWRTRMRVVWSVRKELADFMAAVEQDVEMERILLGLEKPQTVQWRDQRRVNEERSEGYLVQSEVKNMLQLPRIQDNVFGLCFRFPDHTQQQQQYPPENEPDENSSVTAKDKIDRESVDECDRAGQTQITPNSLNQVALVDVTTIDNTVCETVVIPSSPTKEVDRVDDHLVGSRIGEIEDKDGGSGSLSSANTALGDKPLVHETIAQGSTSLVTTHEDERMDTTPSTSSRDDLPPASARLDGALTVQQILTTHSQQDILLELEWAKQALRDRLAYLRKRQRGGFS